MNESTEANLSSADADGPTTGDAFGQLLMECWQSGARPGQFLQLIERDDGFLEADDAAAYFSGPDSWSPLAHWACAQARGRVLDIGSGAGRHSLHLQTQGLEVVALDISPLAAEVCRRRGIRDVVTGTVFDLVTEQSKPFDSFLMLGGNLGLLGDNQNGRLLLSALGRLATPDAVIIGQGLDPYRTDNPLHLAYHQRNRMRGRLPGQLRLRVRHKNLATDWFDYLFTSIDELTSRLQGTGWQLERFETEGASYVARIVRDG